MKFKGFILSIILCVIIIILIYHFIKWLGAEDVEYPLIEYTCEEIKQSLINDSHLIKAKSRMGYWYYSAEEMERHYKFRCGFYMK